ncbi:prepilin peptidase [Haloimpatiens sp. FM7330]|uniref:prepilin peptidase n=1 Tax=Haloimpatiens sp. FM7330 TaxID=3298610 RepID=UPI0036441A60
MVVIISLIALIIGFFLNIIVNKLSYKIDKDKEINNKYLLLIVLNCGIVFLISFFKIGLNIIFIKSVILGCILIIVSYIDFEYKIIPDEIVIVTSITGITFSFIVDISFTSAILGMLLGGSFLFILALIPNALGGGDVKLMFALGSFLGPNKTLWALGFAFIIASIISMVLLLFKIKGRKDNIPFGPFLSLGSFLSFIIFI